MTFFFLKKVSTVVIYAASSANLQIFPPANGGHQAPGSPYGMYAFKAILVNIMFNDGIGPGNLGNAVMKPKDR